MAITFPSSPTLNQEFIIDGRTWIWNGSRWAGINNNTNISAQELSGVTATQFVRSDEDDTINGVLTVATTNSNVRGIISSDDSGSFVSFVPSLGNSGWNPISLVGDSGLIFSTNGTNLSNDNNGFVIAPWSENTSSLKIMENGNIGIGVQTPNAKLDVSGDVSITGNMSVTGNINVTGTVDGQDVSTFATTGKAIAMAIVFG